MGNLSSSNNIKINKHDTTLIEMKARCRELKFFNRNLDEKIAFQVSKIKEHMKNGNQRQAVHALKYKKVLECTRDKSESSLNNLKELIDGIEVAQLEAEIFKSLEKGSAALKVIQKEMPIDKVEKLMEDISDGVANQKEISEILGDQIIDLDDEALLEELAELESSIANDLSESLPAVPSKDQVSKIEIPSAAKEDEFPKVPNSELPESSNKLEEKSPEPLLAN